MARRESTVVCEYCGSDFLTRIKKQRFCSCRCGKLARPRVPTTERFFSKIESKSASECWPWIESVCKDGYGLFKINGRMIRAHRFAWEIENGPIPEGMFVCHRCDNPPCCNPGHLFLGTAADNMADKIMKGRARYARGESSGQAKLSATDVIEIRNSPLTDREIAAKHRIAPATAYAIRTRISWAHL